MTMIADSFPDRCSPRWWCCLCSLILCSLCQICQAPVFPGADLRFVLQFPCLAVLPSRPLAAELCVSTLWLAVQPTWLVTGLVRASLGGKFIGTHPWPSLSWPVPRVCEWVGVSCLVSWVRSHPWLSPVTSCGPSELGFVLGQRNGFLGARLARPSGE